MITFDTFYTIQRVSGLSQDDKPLGMKPGSIFMELDTGKKFIFDGETWHEQPTGGGGGLPVVATITPHDAGEWGALDIPMDLSGQFITIVRLKEGEDVPSTGNRFARLIVLTNVMDTLQTSAWTVGWGDPINTGTSTATLVDSVATINGSSGCRWNQFKPEYEVIRIPLPAYY